MIGFEQKTLLSLLITSFLICLTQIAAVKYGFFVSDFLQGGLWFACSLLGLSLGFLVKRPFSLSIVGVSSIFALAVVSQAHGSNLVGLVWFLPTFTGGAVIAQSYQKNQTVHSYCFDLLGFAAAPIAAWFLMPPLRVEQLLFLGAAIAILADHGLNSFSKSRRLAGFLLAAILCVLTFYPAFNLAALSLCTDRADPKRVSCYPQFPLIFSEDSLVQRIDVRKGPGNLMTVFYDGVPNDFVYPFDVPAYQNDPRYISTLQDHPKVFIVGAAAEGVLKVFKAQTPAANITASEINPSVIRLMNGPAAKPSYNAYQGVRILHENALNFLKKSSEKFDVITLLNTHFVKSVALLAGPEPVHTLEAADLYLSHLQKNGILILEELDTTPLARATIARIVNTFQEALRRRGVRNPNQNTFAYEFYTPDLNLNGTTLKAPSFLHFTMIDFKNSAFSAGDRQKIAAWSRQTMTSPIMKIWSARLDIDAAQDFATYRASRWPNTDDDFISLARPFTWTRDALTTLFLARMSPYLLFTLLAGVLVVLSRRRDPALRFNALFGTEAFVLGFGYFLFQASAFQKYMALTGSATNSQIVMNSALLVLSGLGAWLARAFKRPARIMACASLISILSLQIFVSTESSWKFALITIVTGCLLGMPFSTLLTEVKATRSELSNYLFVNLWAGALAFPIALWTNFVFGFPITFALAMGFYGISLLLVIVRAGVRR